jgi:hypothetical protein
MRWLVAFAVLFLLSPTAARPQDSDLSGQVFGNVNNQIEFVDAHTLRVTKETGGGETTDTMQYSLSNVHHIPIITVSKGDSSEKWITLFSKGGLIVYAQFSQCEVYWGKYEIAFLGQPTVSLHASSFLTEGTTKYDDSSLEKISDHLPWATRGSAVGQFVEILSNQVDRNSPQNSTYIGSLLVSIGFVSLDKPYLYDYNSRPKKLKISDIGGRFEFTYELKDTPNPQQIDFPKPSAGVRITISEIYKGSRWQDTCTNFIVPVLAFQ